MSEYLRVRVVDAPSYEDFEADLIISILRPGTDVTVCIVRDDEKEMFVIESQYVREV